MCDCIELRCPNVAGWESTVQMQSLHYRRLGKHLWWTAGACGTCNVECLSNAAIEFRMRACKAECSSAAALHSRKTRTCGMGKRSLPA